MTVLLTGYDSKKELKASVGKPLVYEETSGFGPEYRDDGEFTGAHRPALWNRRKTGREFFARITMAGGLIKKVE